MSKKNVIIVIVAFIIGALLSGIVVFGITTDKYNEQLNKAADIAEWEMNFNDMFIDMSNDVQNHYVKALDTAVQELCLTNEILKMYNPDMHDSSNITTSHDVQQYINDTYEETLKALINEMPEF